MRGHDRYTVAVKSSSLNARINADSRGGCRRLSGSSIRTRFSSMISITDRQQHDRMPGLRFEKISLAVVPILRRSRTGAVRIPQPAKFSSNCRVSGNLPPTIALMCIPWHPLMPAKEIRFEGDVHALRSYHASSPFDFNDINECLYGWIKPS